MTPPEPSPGTLPPGRRVYAVGDVHGCLDRLEAMHAAIAADLARRPIADPLLVHLGDYVDRGPDSAGVVQRLIDGPGIPGISVVNLIGNHEAMLLAALSGDTEAVELWLLNGGAHSLHSWHIEDRPPQEWADLLPPGHLAQLENLALNHREADYLFVHAGLRPGIPLVDQDPADMLWIREPFLSWHGTPEVIAVHGHTPRPGPEVRPHRIGIDTGAVMGGVLSCAVLEGGTVSFISI